MKDIAFEIIKAGVILVLVTETLSMTAQAQRLNKTQSTIQFKNKAEQSRDWS